MSQVADLLIAIREETNLSQYELAQLLGTSLASIVKWESNAITPSPAQITKIRRIYESIVSGVPTENFKKTDEVFASTHVRQRGLPLFDQTWDIALSDKPRPPILQRISSGRFFGANGEKTLYQILSTHNKPAPTVETLPLSGMSAGKNTYTYDAHTYHTKVPPQVIAELLRHYLPDGGLVLDPFAGSGMTGVAARALGVDCILNELSPAACFIASRFCDQVDAGFFRAAVAMVMADLAPVRKALYATTCRECGRETEAIYYVWSYRVACPHCETSFQLWDVCRRYGKTVREHEILSTFPCPTCSTILKKSRLRRLSAEAVLVGYKCCGSR